MLKSGIGMYWRAGGWYNVAINMLPVLVSTFTAIVSEMKSSNTLCLMLYLIAIAVPSVCVFVCFFLCIVYPYIFNGFSLGTP